MYHSIVISWCFSEVSYVPAQVWLHSASESLHLPVMTDKGKHSFEPSNTVVLHLSQRNWRILTIAYLNAAILVRSPGTKKKRSEESLKFTELKRLFPYNAKVPWISKKWHGRRAVIVVVHCMQPEEDLVCSKCCNTFNFYENRYSSLSCFSLFSLHAAPVAKLVQMQLKWTSSQPLKNRCLEAAWGYIHYNEISICFNGYFTSISSNFYSN